MNIGLYQSVSGMKSMWEDQQIIAANLARSQMPGHKATFAAFMNESKDKQKDYSILNNSPTEIQPYVDFSQGVMENTHNDLDFAIRGDGFFTVREKDGSVSYTRNGQFLSDASGTLHLADGTVVLSSAGSSISIPKDTNYVSVDNDGTIYADGNAVAKLGLVNFSNPADDLSSNQQGRFQVKEGKTPQAIGAGTTIEQGYLEKSNSDTIHEMVRMMEVMRTYQANQQMIAAQDGVTEKLIQTAGSK